MPDLLEGVNRLLVKVGEVTKRNELTTLTDSSRQVFIDDAIDVINEVVDELYTFSSQPRPKGIRSSTLELSATREYTLHSNMTRLRTDYHLIDETNNLIITLVEDGHQDVVFGDIEQDDTGLPHFATINPENGRLIMDRTPDSPSIGRIYKYRYEKDLELSDADDEFPFNTTVLRAIVPAAAELWRRDHEQNFDTAIFRSSLGRAARFLRQTPARTKYGPKRAVIDVTDPFHATSISR